MEDLDLEWGGCIGGWNLDCIVEELVGELVGNRPFVVADRGGVPGSLVVADTEVAVVAAGEPHLAACVLGNIHLS